MKNLLLFVLFVINFGIFAQKNSNKEALIATQSFLKTLDNEIYQHERLDNHHHYIADPATIDEPGPWIATVTSSSRPHHRSHLKFRRARRENPGFLGHPNRYW